LVIDTPLRALSGVHSLRNVGGDALSSGANGRPLLDAAPPDSADAGGSPSDYSGMTCAEIGHSFEVTPGSDPEHDADNDGIACESYP
jgi:hypothetical protein